MRTLLALLLGTASLCSAGPVLGWNQSPEPSVVGYVVFVGTNSRSYSLSFTNNARTNIMVTLTNLQTSTTLYAAVVAQDSSGVVSDFSNEISFTVPKSPVLRLMWSPMVEGPFFAFGDLPAVNPGFYKMEIVP